ncbi:thioesterase II family protein [Micromonospora sp. LOL_014]|uniref:thioesterase II family protein n=1 Tax=Micromonospora sp. LOL_014 TaxID=3345415 RepID=UPI003A888AB0
MNPIATHPAAGRARGWIAGPRPVYPPALRLFCLPYAGGAAQAYESWRGALGADVEVCPIELPGRGARLRERSYTRLEPLVDALATAITAELDVPYALFGHSMGALVAFETAAELHRRGDRRPEVLFVSGTPAPRLGRRHPPLHAASDADLTARLETLGGLPDELRDESELLRCFLPAIRADFAVFETYEYRARPPLGCPVVAFTGSDDHELPPARLAPWAAESTGRFACHVLPGGHFFPRTSQAALLRLVRAALPTQRSYGDA